MLKKIKILLLMLLIFWIGCTSSIELKKKSETYSHSVLLPMDSSIVMGTLQNGLTYYIKLNQKPAKRAILRLVVNAGSILEEEDQKGLAHFVEHMAFNGTKHFPKQSLVDYLEKIGMRFGPDLNAYTNFDETVYMLEVPTDSSSYLKTGIQILSDWAHAVTFDSVEVEKERGVILEEWRLGRGASMRMLEKHLPILAKNSRYAERLPIGDTAIIDTFHIKRLIDFYKKWYRPDLMAVIAVGDFDKDSLISWIKSYFSTIPESKKNGRPYFEIPPYQKTFFSLAVDSEATSTGISIYKIFPRDTLLTINDYKIYLQNRLFSRMINKRLYELMTRMESPPYLYANVGYGGFFRTSEMFSIRFGMQAKNVEKAIKTIRRELERVRQFGFTDSELNRAKKEITKYMKKRYRERNKTNSSQFVPLLMDHFFYKEPVLSLEKEYEIFLKVINKINVHDFDPLIQKYLETGNRVILVNAPQKDLNLIPAKDSILQWLEGPIGEKIKPYQDSKIAGDLLDKELKPVPTLTVIYDSTHDWYEFQLPNHFRIWAKSTPFKEDQVLFQFLSYGGTSQEPDSMYYSASVTPSIIAQSGLGKFSYMDLTRLLSEKIATVKPWISEYEEGFWGTSSVKDLETAFQLLHLYFTQPRLDTVVFHSYINRTIGYLENKALSPQAVFTDTITKYLYDNHLRMRPWDVSAVKKIKLSHILPVYKQRFLNGDEFFGFFVGNFKIDSLKWFIQKYISTLTFRPHQENWRDVGIRYSDTTLKKIVYKGLEPRATVKIFFNGNMEYSLENRLKLYLISNILKIKLREKLREDKSATYSVSVGASMDKIPVAEFLVDISFSTRPAMVDTLINIVHQTIDSLKSFPVQSIYLEKTKNMYVRSRETQLESNNFWMSVMKGIATGELPPDFLVKSIDIIQNISGENLLPVAREVFRSEKEKIFILLPEKSGNGD